MTIISLLHKISVLVRILFQHQLYFDGEICGEISWGLQGQMCR
jgi:hypothetical protein